VCIDGVPRSATYSGTKKLLRALMVRHRKKASSIQYVWFDKGTAHVDVASREDAEFLHSEFHGTSHNLGGDEWTMAFAGDLPRRNNEEPEQQESAAGQRQPDEQQQQQQQQQPEQHQQPVQQQSEERDAEQHHEQVQPPPLRQPEPVQQQPVQQPEQQRLAEQEQGPPHETAEGSQQKQRAEPAEGAVATSAQGTDQQQSARTELATAGTATPSKRRRDSDALGPAVKKPGATTSPSAVVATTGSAPATPETRVPDGELEWSGTPRPGSQGPTRPTGRGRARRVRKPSAQKAGPGSASNDD
jgi:DNA polymerase III gamma/tau subunit